MGVAGDGHTDIVKLLMNHIDCDINMSNNDGSSALMIALEAKHTEIVTLLLK